MSKSTGNDEVKVLMVCLGICRSPMAEAVFNSRLALRSPEIRSRVTKVDSCGTGAYHVGDDPDERTVATCEKHEIPINCTARALSKKDFTEFTHILAMDQMNYKNIINASPKSPSAKISMFSAYSPSHSGSPAGKQPDIVDPYYGQGTSGFERCYKQCVEYSDGLLDELEKETGRGVKAGL